jgi:hypothetical protein
MTEHPQAETLRRHLLQWRGHWIKKLTQELQQALDACGETDLRRAATVVLHGPARCPAGRVRSVVRIADGWQFCGKDKTCSCFMAHFTATSAATNLAKRGVRNAAQSQDVKDRMRATCMERFGVPLSGLSVERREKAEATNLARYGTKNAFASETIRHALRERTRAEYGVDHISQLPSHQDRMRDGVRAAYGVDNVAQHPEVRAKIAATNLVRYGGVAPSADETVRQKTRQTNTERWGGHFTQHHIAPEHRIRGEVDFAGRFAGQRANDIAHATGYHPSSIHRYAHCWNVELDHSGGDHRQAERDFANRLIEHGMTPERNRRLLLPVNHTDDRRYWKEIDFYFPTQRLGIEFNGGYWHSDACGRDCNYHAEKRAAALRQNITLIQIFQDEWIAHPEAVLSAIKHRMGLTVGKTYARVCDLDTIAHNEAADFYNRCHVFGKVSATVHLGLRHNGVLAACMSFTKRQPLTWELVRYATQNSVVGGASRLLRAFEREYQWETIISFADLRWSEGKLYEILGFQLDKYCRPDYAYVIGDRRVHKFNLRKSSKRFQKYAGSGMTEREMAEAEHIPRIYDAGKFRMIKVQHKK